jgi:hypothetical protein
LNQAGFAYDSGKNFAIWHKDGMTGEDIEPIETCKFRRGSLFVERRNRGYTLIHVRTGVPIARLRPSGGSRSFELLYWSLAKQAWAPFGPFGKTVVPVEDVLQIIAANSIFWEVL